MFSNCPSNMFSTKDSGFSNLTFEGKRNMVENEIKNIVIVKRVDTNHPVRNNSSYGNGMVKIVSYDAFNI